METEAQLAESMRHLVILESEVVSELMDDCRPHLLYGFVPRVSNAVNRSAKNNDRARQYWHVMRAGGERDATVDAKEL